MTTEQLENNIIFQIRCLIYEGKPQLIVIQNLKLIALEYAEQVIPKKTMTAHEFLEEKGVVSISERISVYNIEMWLEEYAEQLKP